MIDADAVIGDDAVLLAHVVIYRGARIGDRFFAHSHAQVREYCELGNDVILQNGVVIGADGFGFARDGAKGWHKIVQSGITRLADRVEVQANSCVDRASIGETRDWRGHKDRQPGAGGPRLQRRRAHHAVLAGGTRGIDPRRQQRDSRRTGRRCRSSHHRRRRSGESGTVGHRTHCFAPASLDAFTAGRWWAISPTKDCPPNTPNRIMMVVKVNEQRKFRI